MKERIIGNWRTSMIGVPVLLYALAMTACVIARWITGCCPDCIFKPIEIGSTYLLGWAFLLAKDTLLEGLTLGLFKIKK